MFSVAINVYNSCLISKTPNSIFLYHLSWDKTNLLFLINKSDKEEKAIVSLRPLILTHSLCSKIPPYTLGAKK